MVSTYLALGLKIFKFVVEYFKQVQNSIALTALLLSNYQCLGRLGSVEGLLIRTTKTTLLYILGLLVFVVLINNPSTLGSISVSPNSNLNCICGEIGCALSRTLKSGERGDFGGFFHWITAQLNQHY
jgi:hypothetical protein